MFRNISKSEIINDNKLSKNFVNVKLNKLDLSCNIYKGDFSLDSFNFFLINNNNTTFDKLFTRDEFQKNEHFFTNKFYDNFHNNFNNFKKINNSFVLGSNAANNYYSNLTQFLPRIFFLNNNKIRIVINRNSSTKFRDFIKKILVSKKIDFSFTYLDEGFYKFTNSEMPQFFNLSKSINILRYILIPKKLESADKKIYVTREDSNYRKIINEADIIPILRFKGYKIINPQLYTIEDQIKIFSNVDKIIGAYGSNLANIIFCKPNTEILEIGPPFDEEYEKLFENRYKHLADLNKLKYSRLIADTVTIKKHSEIAKKYINKKVLNKSNYYKNLIVKIKDIKSFV